MQEDSKITLWLEGKDATIILFSSHYHIIYLGTIYCSCCFFMGKHVLYCLSCPFQVIHASPCVTCYLVSDSIYSTSLSLMSIEMLLLCEAVWFALT